MKKTKPKIISTKTNNFEKLLTGFAILVSLLLIAGGLVGMIFVQQELRQSQDIRPQASVSDGLVTVTANPSTVVIDQNSLINFYINTNNVQTNGVQLTFNLVTETLEDPPVFTLAENTQLELAYSEVEETADGYLVAIIALPNTDRLSFSNNSPLLFGRLDFVPVRAGDFEINFDVENSISTIYSSSPPEDELKHVETVAFTIVDKSASPTPTPTPASAPTPSGGIGGEVSTCNQSCGANADCDVNLRCYNGQCRLVTNVSSPTCAKPAAKTPGTNLSSTQTAAIALSCDETCSTNADCDVNLRCYQGACRLALNPGSSSCTPGTTQTVSTSIYGQKGGPEGELSDPDSFGASAGAKIAKKPETSASEATPPSEDEASGGRFGNILNTAKGFLSNNPQAPILALGLGVGLVLIIVFLLIIRNLTSSRPPQKPPQEKQMETEAVHNLEEKIQSLRSEQGPPTTLTAALPVKEIPTAPETLAQRPVDSTLKAPAYAPPRPQSSMVDRLKNRNVIFQGQPNRSSEEQSQSSQPTPQPPNV